MDLFKILAIGGLAALGIKVKKNADRDRERRNTPCYFNDGISAGEFEEIAISLAKPIKRLMVSVDGPVVYGEARSQSGISTWNFKLDFNDWGHITGTYWQSSDNSDSKIPDTLGNRISAEIQSRL